MPRTRRPWGRLFTIAATLTAGLAVALAAPSITTSPAQATDPYNCLGTTGAGFSMTENGADVVTNSAQLAALGPSGSYVQKCDIDLTGVTWLGATGPTAFSGTYDGGGNTISNISMSATSADSGLFRQTAGATIKNLTLNSVTLSAANFGESGALVGQANGSLTIENVIVDDLSLTGSSGVLGGLVGYLYETSSGSAAISHVTVTGSISGVDDLGGLIGHAEYEGYVLIDNVTTNVAITGTGGRNGGMIGYLDSDDPPFTFALTNASSVGPVTGTYSNGGLIGEVDLSAGGTATISNSSSSSTVVGSSTKLGGLIGDAYAYHASNPSLTIMSSYATGNVSSSATSDYIGGLLGRLRVGDGTNPGTATITDSYATGDVRSTANTSWGDYVGGLLGMAYANGGAISITNSSSSGEVWAADDYVGGLIGDAEASGATATLVLANVTVAGTVRGDAEVGGLLGQGYANNGASVTISAATTLATVSATGNEVGGLIGNADSYGWLSITNSTAQGSLEGDRNELGGAVGDLYVGTGAVALLEQVNARGNVTATNASNGFRTGGLIGQYAGRGVTTVSQSSATGDVTSSNNEVGGLIGEADVNANGVLTIESSRADGVVTGENYVGGFIGDLSVNDQSAGQSGTTLIHQSGAYGDVTGTDFIGGLIGRYLTANIGTPAGTVTVAASVATGDVTGEAYVGGLVGRFATIYDAVTGDVVNSYALGDVTATGDFVAGLIGDATGGQIVQTTVDRTFAAGGVTSTDSTPVIGGLVGVVSTADVLNSFWDTAATGQANSAGGSGAAPKTTADMKSFATFNTAGWSIANGDADGTTVWGICDGSTYPFLMWQTQLAADLPGAAECTSGGDGNNNTGGGLAPGVGELVTQPVPTTAPASTTTTTTTVPPSTVAPTDTTPPPVLINGSLPELPAGDVVVVEDGQPVTVEVFVDNTTDLVLQSNTFELRLAGDCAEAACTIDTTPEGREVLTLEENGDARTQGVGFEPGSRVDVWLFSEPRYLGQLTVNADGTFEGNVNLGDIDPGEHTLQVNGTSQTGSQRSANLGVVVNPQAAPTPGPGVLPATGTSTTPLWLMALTLLGLGLVTISRRRAM